MRTPRTLTRRVVSTVTGLVLVWLVVVTLVPTMFGLDTKALPSDDRQGYRLGTMVAMRGVPTSDLVIDDVVDLSTSGVPDLRTVVRTTPGAVSLRPVHEPASDVVPERTADWRGGERVVLDVPYVGLPLSLVPTWLEWVLLGVLVGGTALFDVAPQLRDRMDTRRRTRESERDRTTA